MRLGETIIIVSINNQNNKEMYALIINNRFIDKAKSIVDLSNWINWCKERNTHYKIVDIERASSIKVYYTELGGPNSYGHQEVSFEFYGGITSCLNALMNWAKDIQRVFGPDYRDIRDYFKHCCCFINDKDKSEWFRTTFVEGTKKEVIYI